MEPPSYDEANRHLSVQTAGLSDHTSPPAYTPGPSPSTPPPTYGEAVQPSAFPVLTPPTGPFILVAPPANSGITVHPLTQIDERPAAARRAPTVAVVSQPQPVPIIVSSLRDAPGFVLCPHCQQLVTSKVTYVAGKAAWCTCVILALLGLFCGFCLIPLCMRSMQDAHHSCPHCGKKLHIYER
ncbi:PREDICTED: lipopolysaccharide-induced tumor necrosis factor-alpha factor homolog [Cyprinodon variegatus]|uniref:lipopolysaccharide-induced tumor necrosis factor-alpha factor homolog n=1 Tax=Cyprinodon variegatus TaxID=28743 RepID=UPI000742A0E7|nr:PREDICTED: lipopolysaccharide-induced tumor necrosis factor-alpha factor homolog [Cyprinodon variegatus]